MTRFASLLALLLLLVPLAAHGETTATDSSPESGDDSSDEAQPEGKDEAPAEDGDEVSPESGEEAAPQAAAAEPAAETSPKTCGSDCKKPCCSKRTEGGDKVGPEGGEEAAPQAGAAEPAAETSPKTCGSDCKKPCCSKRTEGGGEAKAKCNHCTSGSASCPRHHSKKGHGHRHKLRLPAGISITPVARIQLRATLFDQDDLEANDPVVYGDPGLREGISLRRVRIGLEASWRDIVDLRVVGGWDNRYDALESVPSYPTLLEALFRVRHILPIELEAGLGRVPFGRQSTASSAHLALWERSLASEHMAPSREPLLTLRGSLGPKDNKVLPEGALGWAVSVSNGSSPWAGDPDPSPRVSGRVRLDLLKPWQDHETGRDATGFGVSLGGSINHNWGLEANTLTGGADLGLQFGRVNLQGELLIARAKPTFDVEGLPSLLSERNSLGWYAQLAVVIVPGWLEVAARVGAYDDNRALADAGDRLDAGGGVNFFLFDGHFKAQLHYVHREELGEGYSTPNDSLILQVQALL